MSRYISLITLLLVIAIVVVVFYKVMAAFFVPLFLAALLVVIFKPFHLWFLKITRGKQALSAFLTTTMILLAVLLPLLGLFVMAAFESQQLLRSVNKRTLVRSWEMTQEKLNLKLPEVSEELISVEVRLDNMVELDQFTDIIYLQTGELADIAIYNDELEQIVQNESDSVKEAWSQYLQQLESLEQLQAEIADPPMDVPDDTGSADDETETSEQESPAMQLYRFHKEALLTRKKFSEFKVSLLGGQPILIWLKELANPDQSTLEKYGSTVIAYARNFLLDIGTFTTAFIGKLLLGGFIMIISLYFFLLDGPGMLNSLKQLSPIEDTYEQELIDEFSKVSRAVVVATLLAAFVQGLLGGIGYYFAGLDSVFLLTLLTGCLALVPFVGAAAVWIPCSLWLFFVENEMTAAIGLAVYGTLVVSASDNLIKPWVLHGQSKLHPLFALLSVLGGVTALGPIGILIGPMVVAFLQTLLKILQREVSNFDRAEALAASAQSTAEDFVIQTKRIGLRRYRQCDLDVIAAMNADPEVMEHFPATFDRDKSQLFIDRVNLRIDENGFGFWAAELLDTGELIGFVGITKVPFEADFTPAVEIGWRLAKQYWGHGYATEAAMGCLEFAFEQAKLDEVVSFTSLTNERSEKVMQRIGMTKAGEFDHPKIEKGHRVHRHVLYKITKDDWLLKKPAPKHPLSGRR